MANKNSISGDENANILFGTPQNDHLLALGGNDALSGFLGDDTLEGGEGNDWLDGGEGNDLLDGGNGEDWVNYGRELNDPNAIGSHGVVVDLNTGKVIDNWGYTDTLISIEGAIGSNFDDTIFGNSNNNNLIGNAGNDIIYGRSGDDWLIGWTGNDSIYGGDGSDWLEGGQGNDLLNGGSGSDWVNYALEASDPNNITQNGVSIDLFAGFAIDNWGNKDILLDIENIIGSRFNDDILGDAQSNNLSGDKGDDLIRGREGNDFLFGGEGADNLRGDEGDDFLQGDKGNDFIDGGTGIDWVCYGDKSLSVDARKSGVKLDLSLGNATDLWGDQDKLQNIEHVIGSQFNDDLTGDNGNNCLIGGDGNDILKGNEGDDWLIGDNGNDTLIGGRGADWLDGGMGIDYLVGGEGGDFFVFSNLVEISGNYSPAVIADFEPGIDFIVMTPIDANTLVEGNQSFTFTDGPGAVGTIWFSNGTLYGDTDGNGADFAISVSGMTSLKASNFLL